MKKNICLLCIIFIISLLYSCNIETDEVISNDITVIPISTTNETIINYITEESEKFDYSNERILIEEYTRYSDILYHSKKYNIINNIYLDFDYSIEKEVFIEFPKISSAKDSEINDSNINKVLKETALNDYKNYWINEGLLLDRTYKIIYADDYLFSVVFESEPAVKGANHPKTECFAITINLETSEPCSLVDFISSYTILEQKISDGKYELIHNAITPDTDSDDMKLFNERLYEYTSIPIENHINDFYVNDDGTICIIIETIQAYAGFFIIRFF